MAIIKDGNSTDKNPSVNDLLDSLLKLRSSYTSPTAIWKTMTSLANTTTEPVVVKRELNHIFLLLINNIQPTFIEGFSHFIENQHLLSKAEVLESTKGSDKVIFARAISFRQNDLLPLLSEWRSTTNLKDYLYEHSSMVKNKNTAALDTLYNYTTNIDFDNSTILSTYLSNDLDDYKFIHNTIQKHNLDINAIGPDLSQFKLSINQYQDINYSTRLAFTHSVALYDNTNFFNLFLKDYGSKINYDLESDNQVAGFPNNAVKNIGIFDIIIKNPLLKSEDKIARLNSILKYGEIGEKHIALVGQFLLNPEILSKHYDNPIYQDFFKHKAFNSNFFDRGAFLNKIFEADGSSVISAIRFGSDHTLNPTLVLLDTFYKNVKGDIKNSEHPFIKWSAHQRGSKQTSTLPFLMKVYEKDISNFTSEEYKKIPQNVQEEMKKLGVTAPKSLGFFKKLFGQKVPQVAIEAPIVQPVTQEASDFNQTLYNKVIDEDVKKHIGSIQLNAEQYGIVFNNNTGSDSDHYMTVVLPKFLNKTVENYLYFATMDEGEAKDNVLTQLKLINKKTFEVLNQGLQEEKHQVLIQGRVQNRMLKNY